MVLHDSRVSPPTMARIASLHPVSDRTSEVLPMNWTRLLQVIEWANQRSPRNIVFTAKKPDRGFNWACNCRVCAELRRLS